jgi:hypothetical protein
MKNIPILSACLFLLLLIGTVNATPPCIPEGLGISQYNFKPEFSLQNERLTSILYNREIFINIPDQYSDSVFYAYYEGSLVYETPVNHSFRQEPNTSRYDMRTDSIFQNLSKINQDLKFFNNSRLDLKLGDTDIGNVMLRYDSGLCGGGVEVGLAPIFLILYYILPFAVLFVILVFAIKHFRHK